MLEKYPKIKPHVKWEVLPNGCWKCVGRPLSAGYPSYASKRIFNLVYEEIHGKPPKGIHIRHLCGNRECINPDHLKAGTPQENIQDMIRERRAGSPAFIGVRDDVIITPERFEEILNMKTFGEALSATRKDYISYHLKKKEGNVSLVSRETRIPLRTLNRYIKNLGIVLNPIKQFNE